MFGSQQDPARCPVRSFSSATVMAMTHLYAHPDPRTGVVLIDVVVGEHRVLVARLFLPEDPSRPSGPTAPETPTSHTLGP